MSQQNDMLLTVGNLGLGSSGAFLKAWEHMHTLARNLSEIRTNTGNKISHEMTIWET